MKNLKIYFLLVLGIFAVSFIFVNESNAQTKKPRKKTTIVRKNIAKKKAKPKQTQVFRIAPIVTKDAVPSCDNCAGSFGSGQGVPTNEVNSTASNSKTISGGVINGKATNLVKPVYPPAAKAVGAKGQVSVSVIVDEDGNVISASAVSGHPLLQPASVAAAKASKFSPTTLMGQKVKVSGVILYIYQ